jgi:hypothetical protein
MSSRDYITSCPIISDPEMDLKKMPRAFHSALDTALGLLKGYGINDRIDASLKGLAGDRECWLAMYVRESQFKGNPVFYVNTRTPGIIDAAVLPQSVTVEDVFLESILHEYGHVIDEWSKFEDLAMRNVIYGPFDRNDEEDFAEYMVDFFLIHKDSKNSKRHEAADKAIRMYVEDVF